MGDFTAKACAKRVIHRNAHSIGISGRVRRVNPPEFARVLRKSPAIATFCRDPLNIFPRLAFIHRQILTVWAISAIIHSRTPVPWRLHDSGDADRMRAPCA
ncbi:hypothetical protein [Pandoraea pulmonicola]|uniref:hypothetical protein n=1 Tax=Pandoraea pulmonicola TaxID=93221 RepID=UPI0011C02341|nr:hypothetical protein [Pandoraea pulmonicola]